MIAVVRELPEREWVRFIETHPGGNIFHTPEIFEVFRRTRGYQPALWAAVQDGQTLALFLPVKITLMNGIMRRLTTRSVVFGSILCKSGPDGQDALDKLLRAYKPAADRTTLFTELRNLTENNAFQPVLRRHGFFFENHLNYLIHLDLKEKDLFQSIGRRTRKNIRHGLNQGKVTMVEVSEREQVATCYELLRQTYKLARVPLADISLFENAFDLLYAKGMIKFTLAKLDKTPAAISVDLFYKDVIYGWYGGVNRTCQHYSVHELLMWHILKQGSGDGYRLYDFGGAGKPDDKYGVRDFKAKFGGDLVDFGRNTYVHRPQIFWLCEKGYRLARGWL